jgi:hypothetical protein
VSDSTSHIPNKASSILDKYVAEARSRLDFRPVAGFYQLLTSVSELEFSVCSKGSGKGGCPAHAESAADGEIRIEVDRGVRGVKPTKHTGNRRYVGPPTVEDNAHSGCGLNEGRHPIVRGKTYPE